jgi:hypothetical protein
MALDATVGSIMANSYVTEDEADDYFADRMHSALWDSVTNKEAFLVSNSRILDWQLKFSGYKTSDIQSMQFPRTGIVLRSGYVVPSDTIPSEVKFAVFELTLASISRDRTADSSLAGIEQVKAGPLFIKASLGGYASSHPKVIPDHVRNILSEYIMSSGIGVVRLERA